MVYHSHIDFKEMLFVVVVDVFYDEAFHGDLVGLIREIDLWGGDF